jgi:hypothetical protein
MPRFRTRSSPAAPPITPDVVRGLMAEVFRPAHFFLAPDLAVEAEHAPSEELTWEVFQGRLLDPAHTRQRRTFEAWNLYVLSGGLPSAEPLLALKLDAEAGLLHVVRGLECHGWEGYASGDNVILSREVRKWVRELAGTLRPGEFADAEDLRDELIALLFHAVVGRRLPLSSVEAPLPDFSFGRLLYCYRSPTAQGGPLRSATQIAPAMLAPEQGAPEQARLLEAMLRATPSEELPGAAGAFAARWSELGRTAADLLGLLRTLFNEVSLSPYTDFAPRVLESLTLLEQRGELTAEQVTDFEAHLLRQLGRHLTAYDLVTFHHRGANYPDALLLDLLLKDYLSRAAARPALFLDAPDDPEAVRRARRLRRRALRQGWLVRRSYEGHPVPDLPTSPGENSRVLPAGHPRVPDEQITLPARRRRRLYADDPLTRHLAGPAAEVLRQSAADLAHPDERRELGAGLFLDRPFGGGKAPAEPDATLLLASVAYSRSIAEGRLPALARDAGISPDAVEGVRAGLSIPGLPLDAIGPAVKPATVSLADARRAAGDFVFLHTTRGSVAALLAQFDFAPLAQRLGLDFLLSGRPVLLARAADGPGLVAYDQALRPRLELGARPQAGYASRGGQEFPVAGLQVVRTWEGGAARDRRGEEIVVRPR